MPELKLLAFLLIGLIEPGQPADFVLQKEILENQHCISVTVEAIALFDGFTVAAHD